MGQMDPDMYKQVLERKAAQEGIPPKDMENDFRMGLVLQGITPPPRNLASEVVGQATISPD